MTSPVIKDVASSANIFFLLYGDSGIGKTKFIGSAAEMGKKVLIIRPPTDHMDSIVGTGAKQIEVTNWTEMDDAADYIRHTSDKWDWVWLDSLSLFQDVGLQDVYEQMVASKGGEQAQKARARYGPDQGEYRVNMWRIENFVRHAVGSGQGFNFGITAHSFWGEIEDDGERVEVLMPWIQGRNMPSKICGMMNVVGYYHIVQREVRGEKKNVRVIEFDKTQRWYAKTGYALPDGSHPFDNGRLFNPTMQEFTRRMAKAHQFTEGDRRTGARRPSGGRPPAGRRGRPSREGSS